MSIKTETSNGVACIEIARVEKKNALTVAMYEAMTAAMNAAHADTTVRAIVIQGDESIFTAGNDLEDFLKRPPQGPDWPGLQFLETLRHAEKPVVAAVNGPAIGVGTTLLFHCDLVYCADNSTFSMPFVSLGLCPEFASSLFVPLLAGHRTAVEKLMLADPITPQEALEIRIVNRVLPPADVRLYARRQAERFLSLPAESVRETKRLLKASWTSMTEKIMQDEGATFLRLLQGAAAKEAFKAFLERRKPDFARFN